MQPRHSTILIDVLAINEPLHINFGLFQVFLAAFVLKSPNVFKYIPLQESFKTFPAKHGAEGVNALNTVVCFVVIGVGCCGHEAQAMFTSLPLSVHSTASSATS